MALAFIPEPKNLKLREGVYPLPARGSVGITSADWMPAAEAVCALLPGAAVHGRAANLRDPIEIRENERLPDQGYVLDIHPKGIVIEASAPEGACHAVRTLAQVAQQSPDGTLPCLRIRDWPDFPARGVTYDISRGRVPKPDRLQELGAVLGAYKINQFHLYMEHTFRYRGHPKIGRGASPLTAADLLEVDAAHAAAGVELVPALATFGHMAKLLTIPEYRYLAEDWGEGRYAAPEAEDLDAQWKRRGWTLSPANPDGYPFLFSLFSEVLPLLRSPWCNIGCDETWDLGLGQTYLLTELLGKGQVYLDHVVKVAELAQKFGKRAMFWSDIIKQYPELVEQIPEDAVVLDWGYDSAHDFDGLARFAEAGLACYACPGTSAWVSLFPRLHESAANIRGYARAGRRHGAQGLLTTDWGDGGHYNFTENSWYGFLYGAEQAWNTKADHKTFTKRFCTLLLGCDSAALAEAINDLGDVAHLHLDGHYQSIWTHLLFAPAGDALFQGFEAQGSACELGRITPRFIRLDAALARDTLDALEEAGAVLAAHQKQARDPLGVLPYWRYAVDAITLAARKLAVLGEGGRNTAPARKKLAKDMNELRERFEALWLARSQPSEIRNTLKLFQRGSRGLE